MQLQGRKAFARNSGNAQILHDHRVHAALRDGCERVVHVLQLVLLYERVDRRVDADMIQMSVRHGSLKLLRIKIGRGGASAKRGISQVYGVGAGADGRA